MTWAAALASMNAVGVTVLGESVVHITRDGVRTACSGVLASTTDQLNLSGLSVVTEQRWILLLDQSDVPDEPQAGDIVLSASGVRYRVDNAAEDIDGMWRLTLATTD